MEANDIKALAAAQPEGRALDQAFYHDDAIYRKELDRLFFRLDGVEAGIDPQRRGGQQLPLARPLAALQRGIGADLAPRQPQLEAAQPDALEGTLGFLEPQCST